MWKLRFHVRTHTRHVHHVHIMSSARCQSLPVDLFASANFDCKHLRIADGAVDFGLIASLDFDLESLHGTEQYVVYSSSLLVQSNKLGLSSSQKS